MSTPKPTPIRPARPRLPEDGHEPQGPSEEALAAAAEAVGRIIGCYEPDEEVAPEYLESGRRVVDTVVRALGPAALAPRRAPHLTRIEGSIRWSDGASTRFMLSDQGASQWGGTRGELDRNKTLLASLRAAFERHRSDDGEAGRGLRAV